MRAISQVAPSWWDYTTLDREILDEAARLTVKDLEQLAKVSAVATVNDDMAADIPYKLLAKGIRVPEQVSITGYDDTEFSHATHPPLTTVGIDRKTMGAEGAKTILRRINDPSLPIHKLTIAPKLIERESVRTL